MLAYVPKEFDDILLGDAILEVGDDHLGSGEGTDGVVGVKAVRDGARVVRGLVHLEVGYNQK